MCIPIFCWAQIDPPPDPVDVPIANAARYKLNYKVGLSILLGAGIVYGIIKVRERSKRKKQKQAKKALNTVFN